MTDKTRAILLGYPNNPTGAIMSKEQIKAIGDWAVKHDIMIISDELYAHLTYGGKNILCSQLSLSSKTAQ